MALLVHHPGDTALNRYLRASGGPRPATLRAVLRALDEEGVPDAAAATRAEVADRSGLAARSLGRALAVLREAGGAVERGGRWLRARGADERTVLAAVAEARERRRALETSRVDLVRTYAETTDCRRRVLLELLGEHHPQVCGHCDSCDAGTSADVGQAALRAGQRVRHAEWGEGTVSVVEADRVTVLFPDRGYATLDLAVALDSGLLAPLPAA